MEVISHLISGFCSREAKEHVCVVERSETWQQDNNGGFVGAV